MAFRYRERIAETGDVIDTRDWNLNQAALAEEFNGRLDRDNLPPNAVGSDHIIRGACTKSSTTGGTNLAILLNDTVAWQDITSLAVATDVDAVIEAKFGCSLKWSGTATTNSAAIRLMIGGFEVARAPLVRHQPYDNVHIFGETFLPPATHTVVAQGKIFDGGDDEQTRHATNDVLVEAARLIANIVKR